MPDTKFWLKFTVIFFGLVLNAKSFGQDESSRVIRQVSGVPALENKSFGVGLFQERLVGTSNFTADGLGFNAFFGQNLSTRWRGALVLSSNEWRSEARSVAPFLVVSQLQWFPDLWQSGLEKWIQPFVGTGLGYLMFLRSRGLPVKRAETESPQVVAGAMAGILFATPYHFGLKSTYEFWRGVKTGQYGGNALTLQFVFGDLSI